ncbi:uncharacterized protein A1O9_11371 [Exophiala aquamarina CBS 119918]|uniref:FAD/NAD(P)-binding domain-containing protein n=1 Tax=Exophiala aquamarina CBS 119918 TaxID=1182545 RepID=A0A072NXC8_9EURO|nr:uncharacterized protein A1O9_11371 [Exophiala aquamarina CBS 119918]KEF52529.1 hypothetical protein A1O9_11371 [Exophiala aquamarina CBS 119918]
MSGKPLLILKLAGYFLTSAIYLLESLVSAKINRWTYNVGDNPKNVVVIGASFAGFHLAKQLAQSIPSGYRVILIERHSHFFFTWNFPRSTVVPGHDHKAFIPYLDPLPSIPEGAYVFTRGTVVSLDSKKVVLEDGSEIEYEYLAVATGSHARYPARLQAIEKAECIAFFKDQQERIKQAQRVIVVGGGAAGMEVASDAKSKYPEKDVTLIHSRDRLLNNFGPLLHTKAMEALDALGVKTYLNERATTGLDEDQPKEVILKNGLVLPCDTLVRCTGQYPRVDLIKEFSPASISPSGKILVDQSLRMANSPNANIFAAGDVIDAPGPSLGRAASIQGMFVADNIVRAIKGKPLKTFKPGLVNWSIELTLGLGKDAMYVSDGVREASFDRKMPHEDLWARQVWKMMGVKPFEDPSYVDESKAVESS